MTGPVPLQDMAFPDLQRLVGEHMRKQGRARFETMARRALAVEPARFDFLYLTAAAERIVGRPEEALTILRRAARCRPDAVNAVEACVMVARQTGRTDVLEAACRRLLVLAPAHTYALTDLAENLFQCQDADGAWRTVRRALRIDSMLEYAWSRAVYYVAALYQTEVAIRCATNAVFLDPGNAGYFYNLGVLALEVGNNVATSLHFSRAYHLSPRIKDAGFQVGLASLRSGRPDTAVDWFQMEFQRETSNPEISRYLRLAQCFSTLASRLKCTDDGEKAVVAPGFFSASTGYGFVARGFASSLRELGIGILPVELGSLDERREWLPGLVRDMADLPVSCGGRVGLHFVMPPYLMPIPGTFPVLYSMVETVEVRRDWMGFSRAASLVVVPTRSSREAWLDAGFPEERVRLCPIGFEPAWQVTSTESRAIHTPSGRLLSEYEFRFLNVSEFLRRKNLGQLIRSWIMATTETDNAILVIKTKGSGAAKQLYDMANECIREKGARGGGLMVIEELMTDEEMRNLFSACTHYYSVSHGEGWDLPMFQAGIMGLELVAPAHSAYLDYLSEETAHLIPSSVCDAGKSEGTRWWQPDMDVAIDTVRAIVRRSSKCKLRADEVLASKYSWNNIGKSMIDILQESGAL